MRLLVSVLAAVLVVAQADDDHRSTGAHGRSRHFEPRLLASAMRISRLDHEIEELKHEIEEAEKIDPFGFILEMHDRLDEIEGSNCLPHHVQCGWQSFDCVSTLVVCDGHRDCYNGWDESEEVCSHGPIRAGNVFSGMANWQSCLPWREHHVSFKITGVMTSKLYPSRLGVAIHTIADVPHEHIHIEGDMEGVYIYGQKRLVVVPQWEDRLKGRYLLKLVCDFNHGDDKRADCHLVHEGSLEECAEIHVTLKHTDTHHTQHRGTDHHHHDDHGVDHRGEIVEHHYDIEGHDHAEHFDKHHHRIDHEDDDDHYIV